jgi:RNA polymerase sigma-70 factor (ECF subfamily)
VHEVTLGNSQLQQQLHLEIQRLPPLMREVLVLRDLQQLSSEEAAARLGISEPAMKSRLGRAREMLRERMLRHTTVTE